MEGLEVSVLLKSEWEEDNQPLRLDSEFLQKKYLKAIDAVRAFGATQFGDDDPTIIHPHEIVRDYVDDEGEQGGVWFFRAQNVRPLRISTINKVYIPADAAASLKRNLLRRNDVLVTRSGANRGDCAIYDRDDIAVASSHTFIIRPKAIDPTFLTVFLNSSYGTAQVDKGVYGAAQPEVAPYYLRNIWIPNVSAEFCASIDEAFRRSIALSTQAALDTSEAETALLSALGLAGWTPPEPLSYTARAADAFAAARLDAQFYAPRIRALLDLLGRDDRTVSDIAKSRRDKFSSKKCDTFHYIEIGDVEGGGGVGATLLDSADAPSRATWHVRTGDVLTSTVRPIRRLSAIVAPDQDRYVASSGFAVLQPTAVSPEVLMTFLRLPVICELMDLFASASMYPAISEADILSLPVPMIPTVVGDSVTAAVQSAFTARARSRTLLAAAKRAVEIAIEDSEEAALAYLATAGEEANG